MAKGKHYFPDKNLSYHHAGWSKRSLKSSTKLPSALCRRLNNNIHINLIKIYLLREKNYYTARAIAKRWKDNLATYIPPHTPLSSYLSLMRKTADIREVRVTRRHSHFETIRQEDRGGGEPPYDKGPKGKVRSFERAIGCKVCFGLPRMANSMVLSNDPIFPFRIQR